MRRLFRSAKKRRLFLGELEREIMEVLWQKGPLTGRKAYEEIRRRRSLALTTVLTILERLIAKGLVIREPQRRAALFRPRLSREEWQEAASEELIRQALDLSPEVVISTFANLCASLPAAELARFTALINAKREEEGKDGSSAA